MDTTVVNELVQELSDNEGVYKHYLVRVNTALEMWGTYGDRTPEEILDQFVTKLKKEILPEYVEVQAFPFQGRDVEWRYYNFDIYRHKLEGVIPYDTPHYLDIDIQDILRSSTEEDDTTSSNVSHL